MISQESRSFTFWINGDQPSCVYIKLILWRTRPHLFPTLLRIVSRNMEFVIERYCESCKQRCQILIVYWIRWWNFMDACRMRSGYLFVAELLVCGTSIGLRRWAAAHIFKSLRLARELPEHWYWSHLSVITFKLISSMETPQELDLVSLKRLQIPASVPSATFQLGPAEHQTSGFVAAAKKRKRVLQTDTASLCEDTCEQIEECTTPKGQDLVVPRRFVCPPAPRKPKSKPRNRASLHEGFFSHSDLELFLSR